MPNGGSVNQTESLDLTTTSLGELSGLPSNLSISTVMVPSYSVRVTRLVSCSQVTRRPWRSRVAVGIVRRLAIDAHASRSFIPAHDAVVGDVAPKQAARVTEIDRSLAPTHARGEPLDARERQPIFCKARVEDLDRGVGIALARLPAAERGAGECRCSGCAGSGGEIASREFHGRPPVL